MFHCLPSHPVLTCIELPTHNRITLTYCAVNDNFFGKIYAINIIFYDIHDINFFPIINIRSLDGTIILKHVSI